MSMFAVTRLGDPAIVMATAGAATASAVPGIGRADAIAALAPAVSHLAVQVLKRLIGRACPVLPPGYEALLVSPDRFSSPRPRSGRPLERRPRR